MRSVDDLPIVRAVRSGDNEDAEETEDVKKNTDLLPQPTFLNPTNAFQLTRFGADDRQSSATLDGRLGPVATAPNARSLVGTPKNRTIPAILVTQVVWRSANGGLLLHFAV